MGKCKKYFNRTLATALTVSMVLGSTVTSFGGGSSAPGTDNTKDLVVYFENWDVYNNPDYGKVTDIPWDKVTYINHAFWAIEPKDGEFPIVSTDAWADQGINPDGTISDEKAAESHFTQYAEMSEQYPDVNVMISIGGWSRCGYFSEMANTQAGRTSFINSCIDTMNEYTWIDGIDIDWEYPGVTRPADGNDQGNPVVGDDYVNYTLLLKEMREAFDREYGDGVKKLTTCSSVNIETISHQNVAAIAPYVDLINVMSYDMTGSYDPVTGHQSALYSTNETMHSVDKGVKYFLEQGVESSKLSIGSPLYCHSWGEVTADENGNVVGVTGTSKQNTESTSWNRIKAMELLAVADGELGWHKGYDDQAKGAYIYNDNPNSQYFGNYLSYENEQSLAAKLDYISEQNIGGMIVWQVGGDAAWDGHPMITQMSKGLGIFDGEQTVYGSADKIPVIEDTVSTAGYPDPINEIVEGDGSNTYASGTYVCYKNAIYKSVNKLSNDYIDNLPDGKWGASCWEKVFDFHTYVSQDELGYWDWAALEGEYVFYDPDKDGIGSIYYAPKDLSNTADDGPEGKWGKDIWEYQTKVVNVEAQTSGITDPINEVVAGDGSHLYSKRTYIYYKAAIYKSINDNSSDWPDNLPDGEWGASCWEKQFDVKPYISNDELGYWDWAALEGEYVFYDPDKDGTGSIYYAPKDLSNTADDGPEGKWGKDIWEYVTTVNKVVKPSGGEGETTTVEVTTTEQVTTKVPITTEKVTTTNNVTTVRPTTQKPVATLAKPSIKAAFRVKKVSKKIKISLKAKVKSAKGYQVKVYTSSKYAKKNVKAIVSFTTKKNLKTIEISGKKLAGKKVLYVKARAYKIVKKSKVFGKWSYAKKVVIKK